MNLKNFIIILLSIGLFHMFFGQSSVYGSETKTFTVLIDPGHGGKDPGVIWPDGSMEKKIAILYAQAFAKELQNQNISYIFTHVSVDSFVPIFLRLRKAKNSHANVLISFHANPVSSDSNVIQLFLNPDDSSSQFLTQVLKAELEKQNYTIITTPCNFAIIKMSPIPAVMINLRAGKSVKGIRYWLNPQLIGEIARGMARALKRFWLEEKR